MSSGVVTIKDVAREAGVSVATVSRTFSGAQRVSDDVRERVREVARRLGYRPNAVARSLRVEETRTLGLVIPNIVNPFFTAVARAVENAAWEEGYSIMLGNTDEDPQKEERYLELLMEKQVDGIIISPARAKAERLQEIANSGVPVIFLDRIAEGIEAPVVRADGRRAVAALVKHLVGLGHERLGIISGPTETVTGYERLNTFLGEAQAHGAPVCEECIRVGDFRTESGAEAMDELLALDDPPTAVFAGNSSMALGALGALRRAEIRIPEDLSFASFDDVGWFELLSPPVTAVSQPIRELGIAAARTLSRKLAGEAAPDSVILDADLLLRESCAAPRPPGSRLNGRTNGAVVNEMSNGIVVESAQDIYGNLDRGAE